MNERLARWMTRGAYAGFALATLLVVAALPVNEWLESVRGWIAGLGFWAPAAYAATYGLATTIFIPASALSLAAGVLFGIWKGSAIVWIGANLATVASFLVARFAARSRVEAMAQARPRFAAVDRALGEEGWKIVALMRLSPVFPFTLQNYLFGVTAIRFWPYAIASAVCMVPGTFLYVYIGYAGGQAAAAASGAPGTEALRLGLQAVGLLATILVTVFVTRIASRAVARHAPERSAELPPQKTQRESRVPPGRPVRLFGLAAAALVAASIAFLQRDAIRAHFYPPRVQIIERYAGDTGTATFDHGGLDRLLAEHVDPEGLVDYAALADDSEALAAYISAVGSAPFEQLGRDEKLALLINAYNAFTLQLVVEHYPVDSIRSIPGPQRWEGRALEGRRGPLQPGPDREPPDPAELPGRPHPFRAGVRRNRLSEAPNGSVLGSDDRAAAPDPGRGDPRQPPMVRIRPLDGPSSAHAGLQLVRRGFRANPRIRSGCGGTILPGARAGDGTGGSTGHPMAAIRLGAKRAARAYLRIQVPARVRAALITECLPP